MTSTETKSASSRKMRSNVPVKDKTAAVLRTLAGEKVEVVADSISVSARRLGEWQQIFIEGGEASLLAASARTKSTNEPAKSGKSKAIGQWSALVIGLFLVVYLVVRLLATYTPQ
jgi:hypothetical protein